MVAEMPCVVGGMPSGCRDAMPSSIGAVNGRVVGIPSAVGGVECLTAVFTRVRSFNEQHMPAGDGMVAIEDLTYNCEVVLSKVLSHPISSWVPVQLPTPGPT